MDLWNGKDKDITLMDNNILALPEHFEMICKQAQKHKLRLDHNQGLDHRLLTPEICNMLKQTKHHEYKFAWDNIKDIDSVDKAIKLLTDAGMKRCTWYVLVGFNSTIEEDYYRFEYLKDHNQNAYCMRYKDVINDHVYIEMASWVNDKRRFQSMSKEQWHLVRMGGRFLTDNQTEIDLT